MLHKIVFKSTKDILKHKREVYSLLSLIGDLGGVLEIFVLLFIFIINPITDFSFKMKAIQKLYLVKTKDGESLFK